MDTSLNKLCSILKQEIGLDARTIGEATIKKILGQRMRACSIKEIDDYFVFLENNADELAALLETAVIPETWFFRDTKPFSYILKHLQSNLLIYLNKPCTLLSIPCSTGEEPYSLAMFFLHAGIPASAFKITAVDISKRALEVAQQGSYGYNSFRGRTNQHYLDDFFTAGEQGQYSINNDVRQCVNFLRVNILDATTLPFDQYFDFVLCRNLLIYFDNHTKKKAFDNLHRILKDDGRLFIGHSEFGAIPKNQFTNTGSANAFALAKHTAASTQKKAPAPPPPPAPRSEPASLQAKKAAPAKPAAVKLVPPAPKTTATENTATENNEDADLLQRAKKLADAGQMQEAEKLCMQHIDHCGDHDESFYLLALIKETAGQADLAENLYRKAIYLNPKHYESLTHLSLLLGKKGDNKGAQLMRQRAERANKV